MNESASWDPSLVKKFSYSNHFKLLNQLRNEVIKYPLNNKKNSTSIQTKNTNQDYKIKTNNEPTQNISSINSSNTTTDLNSKKSNVNFNNSKNFSIYNQSTNNSRELETIIPEQSKTNDKSSSTSFKDRLNQVDMK